MQPEKAEMAGSRQGSLESTGVLIGGDLGRRTSSGGLQDSRAFSTLLQSWVSRKFAVGLAILFPVVVTVWVTWWFLQFFDSIFSPIYAALFGLHVFGLGFVTSMGFILGTGIFFSSWLGNMMLSLGELIIHRLPLIKHIYSASKQVSAALNPENESGNAFKECVLIRHPRQGEYAFAFITGTTVLQVGSQAIRLNAVFVPTNHVYLGDVLLLEDKDIIRTSLSVREGLELVVSAGMALPSMLRACSAPTTAPNQASASGPSMQGPRSALERLRHDWS